MLFRSFFPSNSKDQQKKEERCAMSTIFGTLQTMTQAYQQICGGEEPWIALGNFRNAWYGYAKDRRAALVSEPLAKPAQDTDHTCRGVRFVPPPSSFCVNAMESPAQHGFMIHATRWQRRGGIPNEQRIHRSGSGSYRRRQPLSHGARSFVATGSFRTSMK
jgi:hypothetical protein